MPAKHPLYNKEDFARIGDAIYEREIRDQVQEGNTGKFVVIDFDSGEFKIDTDELAASDRLVVRVPEAQVWLKQIGFRYVRSV